MKIGTRSVLYGAHAFYLHPWFIAWGWWKLYGFPFDPRLWVAFFVHDLGYIGKPNMDGEEGEAHVNFGADLMHFLFDRPRWYRTSDMYEHRDDKGFRNVTCMYEKRTYWRDLCRYHSRFWAKKHGEKPSRLCMADKMAIVLTPSWLYVPMVRATGELAEYMGKSHNEEGGKYLNMNLWHEDAFEWHRGMQKYVGKWVEEHVDGREDTWTGASSDASDS